MSSGLEGTGGSWRSFVQSIDSTVTPSLSLTIDPSPKTPYTMPMPHWGIRTQASMWPSFKRKNGKFSIGHHTSLYEIGIVLATYLRGHTQSPFWLLGFGDCGVRGVYKHESTLGVGNDRKSLQVMWVWAEEGVLALICGIPFPECFPRQIPHAF